MTCRSAALRRTAVALGQGQSALASAPVPAGASAGDPDVFRLGSLLALGDVELDLLPFLQAAVATTSDRAEVHEHVLATIDGDEAVTLVTVEPLHRALRHLDLLVVDAAPAAAEGARARPLLWPACHGTRRGCKPCGRPPARRQEQPGPADKREGWSDHLGRAGACPGCSRSGQCHRRNAAFVVTRSRREILSGEPARAAGA